MVFGWISDKVNQARDWWAGRKEEYERERERFENQKRNNEDELSRLRRNHDSNIDSLNSDISSAERRLRNQRETNEKSLREQQERIAELESDGKTRMNKLRQEKELEMSKMKNATAKELAEIERKYEKDFEVLMAESEKKREIQQRELDKLRKQHQEEELEIKKKHDAIVNQRLKEVEKFEKTQETMIQEHREQVEKGLKDLHEKKMEILSLQRNFIKEEHARKLEIIAQNVLRNSEYLFDEWNKKLIFEFQNEIVVSISDTNDVLSLFLVNVGPLIEDNNDEDQLFMSKELFNDWKLKRGEADFSVTQFQKQMNDFQAADSLLKSNMIGTLDKYDTLRNELGRIPRKLELALKNNRIDNVSEFAEILVEHMKSVNSLVDEMHKICFKPGNFQAIEL